MPFRKILPVILLLACLLVYHGASARAASTPRKSLITIWIAETVASSGLEPEISIFPTTVNENHNPGGQVTTDTFTIQNGGDADLTWTLTEDGTGTVCDAPSEIAWASVVPTGATSAPGGFYTVIVTFDSAGLASGTYTGSLCIASNDQDEPLLPVTLTLQVINGVPQPEISIFPTTVNENHDPGGVVTTDTFTIQNGGDGDLTWTLTEDGTGAVCDAPSEIGWASVVPTGATSAPGGFYTRVPPSALLACHYVEQVPDPPASGCNVR